MLITDMKFKVVKVPLKKPFKIAFAEITQMETIFLKVETDEGIIGYGEAQPFEHVTGESVASTLIILEKLKETLCGQDPLNIERMHHLMDSAFIYNSAAKAGIDLALYDILGKKTNQPVYKLLGGFDNQVMTDMTIGMDTTEEMVKSAKEYVGEGFKALKIKAGINPQQDIQNIKEIRNAVGPDIELRVDANQGWDVKTAINTLNALALENVDLVEQPLKHDNLPDNAIVRRSIPQKLMLDESIHTPTDAYNAVSNSLCDVLNIKLMKSSGIFPALSINAVAEAAHIPCMVGCMTESRLGIAAAASIVAAKKNIKYADVDSYYMMREVDEISGGFTLEDGILTLSEKPGFGVEVTIDFEN